MKESTCSDWTAILDSMPPGPPKLRVAGKCTFPTPGYKVSLKKKEPQGINPAILILIKNVVRPDKPEPDVVTTIPAEYSENTNAHYKNVQIEPDGVSIEVKEVH